MGTINNTTIVLLILRYFVLTIQKYLLIYVIALGLLVTYCYFYTNDLSIIPSELQQDPDTYRLTHMLGTNI